MVIFVRLIFANFTTRTNSPSPQITNSRKFKHAEITRSTIYICIPQDVIHTVFSILIVQLVKTPVIHPSIHLCTSTIELAITIHFSLNIQRIYMSSHGNIWTRLAWWHTTVSMSTDTKWNVLFSSVMAHNLRNNQHVVQFDRYVTLTKTHHIYKALS